MRRVIHELRHLPESESGDQLLLQRFVESRDEAAFELVVRRHAVLVAGVCGRILHDAHLAEDATQAVFLILARKADSLRGTNVAGWLFRVSRRVAMRAKRTADRRRKRETSLTTDPPAPVAIHPTEHSEVLALLDEEIARLPERFRLPVLLCYLGGSTTEDAARTLGCPRGTVLSRLSAAREKLAAGLARRGFVLPIGVLLSEVARPLNIAAFVPTLVRRAAAFRLDAAAEFATPHLLANGVLTAMKTTKFLVAAGIVFAVAGLAGGYGVMWVGAGEEPAPVAAGSSDGASDLKDTPLADLRINRKEEFTKILDNLQREFPRPIPKNGTELERLRTEQLNEGVAYCLRFKSVMDAGGEYTSEEFEEFFGVISKTFLVGAELELQRPAKLKWLELRVQTYSYYELHISSRVNAGGPEPARRVNLARFKRLQAEVDLVTARKQK